MTTTSLERREVLPTPPESPPDDRRQVSDSPSAPPPPAVAARPAPASLPARIPAPTGENILPDVITFGSSVAGFRGRLEAVVRLPDQSLCWRIRLHNGSAAPVRASIDLAQSYVADGRGQGYPILRADYSSEPQPVFDVFDPGSDRAYWLVFDPPVGGQHKLSAFLRGVEAEGVRFDAFRVELTPQGPERPPEPAAVPAGGLALGSTALPPIEVHGLEGLEARVDSVVLLAADAEAGRSQSRMRWTLTLHNTSLESIRIGLALKAIHLEDEFGNVYAVLASSVAGGQDQDLHIDELDGGLRVDPWLEFAAPRTGVRHLKARFASHDPTRLQFDEVAVDLPEIAAPYRYAPQVLGFAAERGGSFETSLAGLEARLIEVERLENGRLRWQLELRNVSAGVLDVGFDFETVQLTDGVRSYRLLGSDTGLEPGRIYNGRVPAGGRVFHWLDFAEPPASSSEFQLILVSHDRSYTYRPLLVQLTL